SYNDLPAHLKTCLLYLSIFPESYVFQKYRLVKKWTAEGIVTQKTKLIRSSNKKEAKLSQELSLEETASQYLDELVNRSIIHPLECNNNGEVISYHIHPMMFGVLKGIAIEEKFAASLDDKDISRADPMNFPRLSIDCPDSENLIGLSSMNFDNGVHSLTVFGHANQFLLKHFKGTRVLDLEDCKSIERSDVEYICNMVLLKQLCLAKTDITELPPQIGNLQHLEGLDVGGTQITELPTQIGKLKRLRTLDARKSQVKDLSHQVVLLTGLVHLLIGDSESCEGVKLPDGIGNMTSLQQLCTIDLRKCSTSSLKDLGTLPDLTELGVVSSDEPKDMKLNDALLSCLDKSTKLRSLVVYGDFRLSTLQSYSPYKYLNCRKKLTVGKSLKVPIGFAGQSLLVMLDIRVCKLEEDDLKILQELPRLQSLIVRLEVLPTKMIRISCEGFAKLERFCVDCQMPRVIFEEGAMPKLEHLELKIYGGSTSEEHMGIMHLLNLQMVTLRYSKWHATNKGVRETTDAMKTLAREQKNKFTLFIAEEDKDASSSRRTEIEEEGFKLYDAVANPAAMASTDPAGNDLVGIDGKQEKELMKLLSDGDNVTNKKLEVVSVVGFAGLGKTALVKTVYEKIKGDFDCTAFVLAGQNPDLRTVLRNVISQLTMNSSNSSRKDEQELVNLISEILENKRYLIVIDDIWDEQMWTIIRCALSNKNNLGSRIITTTRIVSVSKACLLHANGSVYQMEPLSDDNSKKLLYHRIFGSVSRGPHEFEQVSIDILKKCGGVPLAIITMASVLAGDPQPKTKDEWHALLKSIGRGHEENIGWKDMQRTLSYSYYDLPAHLKTCLLYLSIFPVSHPIEKQRFLKKMIAEGIVTQDTFMSQKFSLEELAIQYLDELLNRNVIHLLECNSNGMVITYHIHPMMHDTLKAIAIEQKFAASFDAKDISRAHRMNFRHLSIDSLDSENLFELSSMAFDCDVQSLTVFGDANQLMLRHFKVRRVLDLEGCKSIVRADVKYICRMVLLKQLCLANTDITELPPEIGNLRHLEGLDVGGTQITQLPIQIGKLKHLRTLDARKSQVKDLPHQVVRLTRLVQLLIGDIESNEGVKLPDGIGKMTSLQQLCTIDLRKCSTSSLNELGELSNLREIAVVSSDEPEDTRMTNALLSSFDKSAKLRSLVFYTDFRPSTLQLSSPYKYLNSLEKLTVVRSLKVPIGFTGQYFFRVLDIRVCKLEEDDLKILQELPRLQSLILRLEVLPTTMVRISCEGFAELESLYVDCGMPRMTFEEGAMPNLEDLGLQLYAGSASEEHMGIKHLLNLRKITLRYSKWYATNKGVEEITEAVKTEAKEHRKQITLCIEEEEINGICNTKTETFEENRVTSCSRMTEIKEEDGHADWTAIFDGDGTHEGGLHPSIHDIASCSRTKEIEEVAE
ncbi:disease resistance protein Pik-1-like, partial [Triticum aestivum]|uniref:disease resistance protein Pik-1-like n=1 Tax=Triticum aestivum TaxID=4565 RepID=UPI001D014637